MTPDTTTLLVTLVPDDENIYDSGNLKGYRLVVAGTGPMDHHPRMVSAFALSIYDAQRAIRSGIEWKPWERIPAELQAEVADHLGLELDV